MPQNDTSLIQTSDISIALGVLSRFPVEVNQEAARDRAAAATWAYPIAGAAIGFAAVLAGWIATALGLPDLAITGVVLATLIMISGAMHEDGLADTFDGLWGGFDRQRRLEIMKDSHIGAYGVLALVLSVLTRFGLILSLVVAGNLWVVIAISAASRAPMVFLMSKMSAARPDGLSHSVGRPRIETALLAALLALLIGFFFLGGTILHGILLTAIGVAGLAWVAEKKIGGQTGDILGASQQISEIAFLAAVVAALPT